jgi:glycosyltransferase involved in cell wall biosynthesis
VGDSFNFKKLNNMSLLSIIIPFYNSEKTIGRALDSLNRMSLKSKELTEVIIVDDGSQDRGTEIVESKKKGLSPLTVVLIRQENQGSAGARNTGLEHSSGEWIFFLDADDELAFDPIPYITKFPGYSALGFTVQLYKGFRLRRFLRPVRITVKNYLDILTAKNPLQPSNFIIKKDKITSSFNAKFMYLEDWIFWFENPRIFENVKIINELSATLHVHGGNKSSDYMMSGKYRKEIADEMLRTLGEKLTKKQRNNLFIQAQIGELLQGKKMKIKNFFRLPCDITLFGKLIVYFVLRRNFSKFDIYGS